MLASCGLECCHRRSLSTDSRPSEQRAIGHAWLCVRFGAPRGQCANSCQISFYSCAQQVQQKCARGCDIRHAALAKLMRAVRLVLACVCSARAVSRDTVPLLVRLSLASKGSEVLSPFLLIKLHTVRNAVLEIGL